jgi:hypothetical protein
MEGWGSCLNCGEPTYEQSYCDGCSDAPEDDGEEG